ncbi:hypothetical protein LOTGIDRAFT_168173 [Lottia gigantea]|uniref:ZP domain-containing protein n=1 Tax=Lottia gigantea TaxID=225164 RepID=V3ZVG5_LOTGI|nr:hypothetical protein LOTGIDRAFT_168173 [Lottia gigantea]ESO84916.1 hypothetical protein LOTGIDRAFT_168173 [Lottia gigantea]
MELFSIVLVIFCISLVSLNGEVLDDFIFDVEPQCGDSLVDNNPVVTVKSDFPISVVASCANGDVGFLSVNGAEHLLQGTFLQKGDFCLFTRRGSTNVYTIEISIRYGVGGSEEHITQKSMMCIVTCTFDLNGMKDSQEHSLTKGILAPVELRVDAGQNIKATLTLDVYDVGDNLITTMRRGRKVYLSATTDGSKSELGLQPVSCFAEGVNSKKRFQFLRAGCGAGMIFDQTEGFDTTGLSTRSPYFRSFQINDEQYLTFECVFTLCASACDGNSCGKGRSKRSSGLFPLIAKSRPIAYENVIKTLN